MQFSQYKNSCVFFSYSLIYSETAVKLGRTPILVDLDVSQNMLSIPGTIAASPMTLENISPPTNASSASLLPNTNPLVFWYGSTDLSTNPDLYKSFLDKMGECIDARLANDANNAASNANMNANPQDNNANDAKSSGIIVNGCGWIEDMGYELMKHTIQALNINVVLVMGHDRLYSMLSTHYNKMKESIQKGNNSFDGATTAMPKVIKLARSGGIVSRDSSFRRISRTLAMKQYFFGESIVPPSTYLNNASAAPTMMGGGLGVGVGSTADGMSIPTESLVHQYSPLRLDLSFTDVKIYKISNVTLSSSMLPVSAKQSSEAVQLTQVTDISAAIKSCMLAVCHPAAVDKYEQSGEASDLYMAGVPGFVVVDKVDMNREMISLLSPCAGSLASTTLLLADITWRE
jgi:polyribonucleotide 5'-hydroxyl-kinase